MYIFYDVLVKPFANLSISQDYQRGLNLILHVDMVTTRQPSLHNFFRVFFLPLLTNPYLEYDFGSS